MMKEGPDIAYIGSLIGDPARANMLTALLCGKALTASELAKEAGITPQTASSHLRQLQEGKMLIQRKQGRHRYFALADEDVGDLLESLLGYAMQKGLTRVRTGPKDPILRHSRVCYNHLAGEKAVQLFDSLVKREFLKGDPNHVELTRSGRIFVEDLGIDLAVLEKKRRPLCKSCLDWSERRSHLSGSLGSAFLDLFYSEGWATREGSSRIVTFTPKGKKAFNELFSL
ncbi:MAG: metalloregulator ArsR/SmtB family transcription factor [Sneathiellales bacterium]|nr:metalloregulator ArsR/SmtB family transcription factor [Sneathiellales bacterium]